MRKNLLNFWLTLTLITGSLSAPVLASPGRATVASPDPAGRMPVLDSSAASAATQDKPLLPWTAPALKPATQEPVQVTPAEISLGAYEPTGAKTASRSKPSDAGITSIAGSTVTTSDVYLPGGSVTACFSVYNASTDVEWLDLVALTFPAGWTVACNSQDATDSGGHSVSFTCNAVGNTVSYSDSDGGFGEVYGDESWGFCVDVSAPASASGPQSVGWELSGDVWGDPPHDVNGTLEIGTAVPILFTSNKAASGVASSGDLLTYTVFLRNTGALSATNTSLVDPIPADAAFAHIVGPAGATYNPALDQIEWTGTVTSGAQIAVTFAVTLSAASCGTHITNTATITDPGIPEPVTLQHVVQVADYIYHLEDWEASDGGYTPGGANTSWEWGAPTSGPAAAHSGSNVWATNLSGDYNNGEDSYLTSPTIDLSSAAGGPGYELWLEWWQWLETEPGIDYARLEARGGTIPWTLIYGPEDGSIDLEWTRHRLDISRFAGASDFQIRFGLQSDGSIVYPGWYLDDVAIYQCLPPGVYVSPHSVEVQGCVGVTQTHTFYLANHTGTDDDFLMSYSLENPATGSLEGPSLVSLNDGLGTSFAVTLTPELCLPAGLAMDASIEAQAASTIYSGVTHIVKTTLTSGFWREIATEPDAGRMDHVVAGYADRVWSITGYGTDAAVRYYDPSADAWTTVTGSAPSFGINYARSGCQVGNTVYVYGDATTPGFAGLWSYNMDTNVWSSLTPGGTPPAQTGIWAPAWVYDPEGGLCYMTGGATVPGSGDLSTVYVYDPAANAWVSALPAFGTVRDFHAAWIVGGGVDKMLCVAGGADAGGAVLSSTQCYDFDAGSWNGENADLGPLPASSWGMGYAEKLHGGTDEQLWMVAGIEDGALSRRAVFYDVNAGVWRPGGEIESSAVYRTSATTLNNEIYKLGGATGGFAHTGQADRHIQCPVCVEMGWLEGQVYDYDGTNPAGQPATVHLEPGPVNVPVDASGYYTAALIPFTYAASASAVDYPRPDGPYAVIVSDGVVSARDFALDRPDIEIAPTALSAAAVATSTVSEQFTITNSGTFTLGYSIREMPPLPGSGVTSLPAGQAQETAKQPGIVVEPALSNQINAGGTSGYLIYFDERPDLSPAYGMDWAERGRFVVHALQQAAERSQARVRAYLDARGVPYKAYWIDNVILVGASTQTTFNGLMSFSEIAALRARRQMMIYEPDQVGAASRLTAVESNITHVGADRVWGELGVTGAGIVVANIDTGVNYQHEALVNQYRGNLGGGSFDHNFNWWDPITGTQELEPNDWNDHGSHTMGTIVGSDNPGDPLDAANAIGMAPGAAWMACQAFEADDSELLECGQFMAAPWDLAGANANSDLRPHVVNNSWGDCALGLDPWYKGVISAWHALGIYPVFSNGNASNCGYPTPPGLNTVGNPARYGEVTGVGSTGQNNGQYAPHSNWGPTDDPDIINPRGYPNLKPQVVAPGVNIRSSGNTGNEYLSMGGTSMSAPHVAGLVALMWQAGPCLVGDYANTETIIEQTAVPVPYDTGNGDEGPGNVPNHATGWGEINAYAAVAAAMDHCGTDWLSWAATSPVTGTLTAGNQTVQVDFTCNYVESQKPQPLAGSLLVQHNDPTRESIPVHLELFCAGATPNPTWEKALWINGEEHRPVAGPHVVRSGDELIIVDRVGAASAAALTSVLTETWDASLELLSYDTDGVGALTLGDHTLNWNLDGVAPNTWYAITKTFEVQYGDWVTDLITESYRVAGAVDQPDDVTVILEHYVPAIALDKSGPDSAVKGDVISFTLVVSSTGGFFGNAVLTDVLPSDLTFVGNLTYTQGRAWEDSNVVYWTSYTDTVPPPVPNRNVLILTPDSDVSSLHTALGICSDIQVTVWDGNTNGEPSVADLQEYGTVILGNDVLWSSMDKATVGDNLADYIDLGGKVIEGLYVQSFDEWGFAGRYMTDGYSPFTPATLDNWAADTMTILNASHPVMAGVTVVTDTWGHQNPGQSAGADLLAGWTTSGYNYVAANADVVALNQLLHQGASWSGDVGTILCNAIDYLVPLTRPPMPAAVTLSFDVDVSGGGLVCNLATLDWSEDYTTDRHCVAVPVPDPTWEKQIWISGDGPYRPEDGPFTDLLAGDTIQIVDRVSISYTRDISFTLTELWAEPLTLTQATNQGGSLAWGAGMATWDVEGGTAGAQYVLTKTFEVGQGPWDVSHITETLWVEDADTQPQPVELEFVPSAAVRAVTVTADEDSLWDHPAQTVTYTLTVENAGTAEDSFTAALGGAPVWTTNLAALSIGPLAAGATGTLEVYVGIPADAVDGATDMVNVSVTSQGDASASDSVSLTTTARWRRVYLPVLLRNP